MNPESPSYSLRVPALKMVCIISVSYTHLRAHETVLDLVCRLLLEKKTNCDATDVLLDNNENMVEIEY